MKRTVLFTVLLSFVVFGCAAAAHGASIGVGTDTGKIIVEEDLFAGSRNPLPVFRVGNTGTESMGYVLKVAPYGDGRAIPASWVTFKPDVTYLKAEEWVDVQATIKIPGDAAPGQYTALLAATPQLPSGLTSAKVNIGAGPRLELEVVAASPLQAAIWTARGWFAENMPWSLIGIAVGTLVLLVTVVWLIVRRAARRTASTEVAG